MKHKLSIITINRNNAAGLRKTMESVFSQTYKDFEYIIVDGASTDGSLDVIKEYESVHSLNVHSFNFTWLSEPDNGVYQAMNHGIEIVLGRRIVNEDHTTFSNSLNANRSTLNESLSDYILFLNSGDFLVAPDVIERVMSQCNGADILCARCNVSDSGKVVWTSNPPDQMTFGALYTTGLAHQSTFIKRALFETCGLYREDFKYNSDIAFWYKAIIDHHATTQRIDVVTTDYNLDGISSKENKDPRFMAEHTEILAPYAMFVPDYEAMKKRERENAPLYWIRKHKCIYKPLLWLYRLRSK